jgi:UDP-3-O-[3-hydroxymyristoyl] glucosamine N-acyltransferase
LQSKLDGNIDASCRIIGKVWVGKDTVIRHGTTIKGLVIISENCEIGPDVPRLAIVSKFNLEK